MVLNSSIHNSALPQQQQFHWGLRVTQNAYFFLLTHTDKLLLVIFCETPAGIEVSFRTDGNGKGNRWTDRHGSLSSYLDLWMAPIGGVL